MIFVFQRACTIPMRRSDPKSWLSVFGEVGSKRPHTVVSAGLADSFDACHSIPISLVLFQRITNLIGNNLITMYVEKVRR